MRTLSEVITDHSEIGKAELWGNQEKRENVLLQMVCFAVLLQAEGSLTN